MALKSKTCVTFNRSHCSKLPPFWLPCGASKNQLLLKSTHVIHCYVKDHATRDWLADKTQQGAKSIVNLSWYINNTKVMFLYSVASYTDNNNNNNNNNGLFKAYLHGSSTSLILRK
jgi:hypothetical protein